MPKIAESVITSLGKDVQLLRLLRFARNDKQYDATGEGTPVFSPDGQHIAYSAQEDDRWLVVIDGEEGVRYDSIITVSGAGLTFVSPDQLHYLIFRNSNVYLVEERIE